MIKQLSPGIEVTEIDNIETVNIFSEGINAAMVGDFAWGPVDYPIKINNVNDLKKYFATPKKEEHNISYFTAYNFLNYESGGLYVVRSAGDNARNAVSTFDDTDFIHQKYTNPLTLTANGNFDSANSTIKVLNGTGANTVANVAQYITDGSTLNVFKDPRDNVLQYTDEILENSDIKSSKDPYYTTPNNAFTTASTDKGKQAKIASLNNNDKIKNWNIPSKSLLVDKITSNTFGLNVLQVKHLSKVPSKGTSTLEVYLSSDEDNKTFNEIKATDVPSVVPSVVSTNFTNGITSILNKGNYKSDKTWGYVVDWINPNTVKVGNLNTDNKSFDFSDIKTDHPIYTISNYIGKNLQLIYISKKIDETVFNWDKMHIIFQQYKFSNGGTTTNYYKISINSTDYVITGTVTTGSGASATTTTTKFQLNSSDGYGFYTTAYENAPYDYKLSANIPKDDISIKSPITFSTYVALANTATSKSVTETDAIRYVQLAMKNGDVPIKTTFNLANTSVSPKSTAGVLTNQIISYKSIDNIDWYRISMTSNITDPDIQDTTNRPKTFTIRAIDNNLGDTTFSPNYSDLKNNIVLHIAAPQVEQNDSLSSYKINPGDASHATTLPYISTVKNANTTTNVITLSDFEKTDETEIYVNDKLYFRTYNQDSLPNFIKNKSDYQANADYINSLNYFNMFIARYPGDIGNSLKVILNSDPTFYSYLKQYFPDTKSIKTTESVYTVLQRDINDVLYFAVIDTDGAFSDKKNNVLEAARLSKCKDVFDNGYNIYYYDWINTYSKYVYMGKPLIYTGWNTSIDWFKTHTKVKCAIGDNIEKQLAGGKNDSPKSSNYMDSFNTLKNNKEYNYDIIMGGSHEKEVIQHVHDNIVLNRKDCVLTISPPINVLPPAQNTPARSVLDYMSDFDSSYIFADSGWKYQYNLFNSKYFWMPLNPDIAGVIARTSIEQNPWYSPAGYNRGKIKNVTKLAWNPTKDEMDEIYPVGINPVIKESNEGTILFGDRMKTSRPTIMNKFNVRFLFLTIEKYIKSAAKFKLFEFNDTYTRETFKAQIESYLRSVQSRRGIEEFMVVCDESNNTSDVINSSGFVADIYIRPAMSINFIQLNFINTPSGIEFNVAD